MGFVEHLDGGDRTARIARDWLTLTATGDTYFLQALAQIPPDVPTRRAIALANVEGSAGVTPNHERDFYDGLAEVLSTPRPADILFAGFAKARVLIARTLAHRMHRDSATLADFTAADLQLFVVDQWAGRLSATRFRRRTPDVLRDITADWTAGHKNLANSGPGAAFTRLNAAYVAAHVAVGSVAVLNAADIMALKSRSLLLARLERGLGQETLAENLRKRGMRVRRNEIRRWEHGDVKITDPNWLQLVNYFDHDPAWWLQDHTDELAAYLQHRNGG